MELPGTLGYSRREDELLLRFAAKNVLLPVESLLNSEYSTYTVVDISRHQGPSLGDLFYLLAQGRCLRTGVSHIRGGQEPGDDSKQTRSHTRH